MLERIIQFSITNRLLVILVTLGFAAIGAYALLALPIDAVPDITNNQVQINTLYPAFSPLEIEKQVTFPIETALAGIPGLESTRSLSRNGFSQVTAIFKDSVDIYFARQQVTERLAAAKENLPPGSEPSMGPISTGLGEVYMWVVEFAHPGGLSTDQTGNQPGWQNDGTYLTPERRTLKTPLERAAYLREVQDWVIRAQLRNVPGVAGVDSIGGYVKHYAVQPDPYRMLSFALTFADIANALERNSQSTGAGYIENRGEAFIVRSSALLANEQEISEIAVGKREGIPIRIRDVATVNVGKELRTGSASQNGQEVVVGTALMLIGENSRTVAQAVHEKLAEINRTLPPDIQAKPVLNRMKLVDATIQTVEKNLIEGALLVIVVLFILLGNIRAALISALAIPLSMLLTAIGMVSSHVSGNLMSLGAVDFGLIVDGAVIIVENCIRRLTESQHHAPRLLSAKERLQIVIDATREMVRPSAFGQAIIITVYIPIFFLTGIEGKMFNPMAMTVVFALVAAFVLSLTFVPAAIAASLTGPIKEHHSIFLRVVANAYRPLLHWGLQRRMLVVSTASVLFILSLILFSRLGQEFIPTLDEKDIAMHAMRIPSTSLTQSQAMQFNIEKALNNIPEIALAFSKTGTAEIAADPMPVNVSDTFIIVKPKSEWPDPDASKDSLIRRIQETLEAEPGNAFEFTQPIQMRFNELIAGVRSDVAIKIFGDDFGQLVPTAQSVANALRTISGAEDVKVEQATGLPLLDISIDREKVARLGLDVSDVQEVILIAVGGKEAGFILEGDRRFDVIVRLPEPLRNDVAAIRRLPIALPPIAATHEANLGNLTHAPRFVPLEAVAKISVVDGPNQISRENGKRRVVVQANVRNRDIGSFVDEAEQRIKEQVQIPPGYWSTWGGQFENLVAAKKRLSVLVPLCFALIFLLLFTSLGSAKQALMVFSGVPLALTGGIVALWLRGLPFSISAAVGFIALSGVAVLNGLVMISFINDLRKERSVQEAIVDGALIRLRPVLMTALVASLGFVPMALATGTGAEVQRPIATVVIGGLVSATVLTLLVLPALYSLTHSREEAEINTVTQPHEAE
jgi:cobalt-zinc-cadmium resistance protein CzcA